MTDQAPRVSSDVRAARLKSALAVTVAATAVLSVLLGYAEFRREPPNPIVPFDSSEFGWDDADWKDRSDPEFRWSVGHKLLDLELATNTDNATIKLGALMYWSDAARDHGDPQRFAAVQALKLFAQGWRIEDASEYRRLPGGEGFYNQQGRLPAKPSAEFSLNRVQRK